MTNTIEQSAIRMIDIDRACEIMHIAYERAAKGEGWLTNPASRVQWKDVPLANKNTMHKAVSALLDHVLGPHEPDHGRPGNPVNWCPRCRMEAALSEGALGGPTSDE